MDYKEKKKKNFNIILYNIKKRKKRVKMNLNIYDLIGIVGSIIIAYFYFYAQYKYTFLNSFNFFLGNIIGSLFIVVSLILSSFNIASFIIETLWIAVSFYGIYKYHVIKDRVLEDLTVRQNQFSIDNIPTKITERIFNKDDIGFDIIFKDQISQEEHNEKSMSMDTFLFNGTTMLTPNAITSSILNINNIENEWRMNKNVVFIYLDEKDYGKEDLIKLFEDQNIKKDKLIKKNENKPILFFVTGFMNKIEQYINKDGSVSDVVFTLPRAGISGEASKYISEMDVFSYIIIDSISFETEESKKNGFETTFNLMNIKENEKTFTPLVYHAKTPSKKNGYNSCSIRLGNVPCGIIPGYPVSVKIK